MTRTKCPRKGTRMQYFGPDTRAIPVGTVVKVQACVNDTIYVKVKGEENPIGVDKDTLHKKLLSVRETKKVLERCPRESRYVPGVMVEAPAAAPARVMSDEERMHMGLRGIETVGLRGLGSDTYNYYVVRDGLVVGGFEFKEDAQDSAADEPSPSKVFHKSKIPMQDRQKFHADNFVMEKLGGLGADAEKRKPVTHSYPGYSTTEMYNLTQTNDAIRDGDLFICNKGETVGFLMQAWPTLLWGELGALEKAKSIESFRAEYPETFAAFDAMMLPASKKAP